MKNSSGTLQKNLILLLCLVGAGAALYLTQLYYAIHMGTGGFKSLCNLGQGMSCESVALSRWADFVPGFPLSSFVGGWFISLFILGLMLRSQSWENDALKIGTGMSLVASFYSLILLIIMLFVIKNICIFCLVIDAVNFGLLGLFFTLRKKESPALNKGRLINWVLVTLACFFTTVVVEKPTETMNSADDEIQAMINQTLQSTPVQLTIKDTTPILGKKDAPVTIVEYSDFMCPFCKKGALVLHNVLQKYPNEVRVAFKNFPLDQACNRLLQHPMHAFSCKLARNALCANAKGKFESVYEKLFETQEDLKTTSGIEIAETFGLNKAEMESCSESEAIKQLLNDDIEEGLKLDIKGTPAFYINGKKLDGVLPIEAWDRLIQAALQK